MKKFTKLTKVVKIDEKQDNFDKKIKKMLKKCLNIEVNGDLDHYLTENIKIDGFDTLTKKIKDITKEEILKSNKLLLEEIKFRGMHIVEKKINNK